ncbi:MAG: PKD domain-containing protein [Thermoplasmata archaeon]|nr:MAG: PKD domain-containing protein [Thermoplasmata archaeon]
MIYIKRSAKESIIIPLFIVFTSIILILITLSNLPDRVNAEETEPEVNFYMERELLGHFDDISALAWSSNGQSIASGSSDNTTRIWSTGTWSSVKTLYHTAPVSGISWSKTTLKMAIGLENGTIEVYNAVSWILQKTLSEHLDMVQGLSFSPDGTKLSSGDDSGNIKIWDVTTWNSIQNLDLGSGVKEIQWSNNADKLAACSNNGTISIWETSTWTNIKSFDTTLGDERVESIFWSPDDTRLASSSEELKVIVWDTQSWEALQTLSTGSTPKKVMWSPDNTYIAAGVMGGIKIWNTTDWNLMKTTELAESSQVSALTISPDGDRIASGAPQKTSNAVMIWKKNFSPVLDPIGNQEAYEDQLFTLTVSASDDDQLTFSDDSLLFDIDPDNGQISFIPTNDDVGEHTITITVSDGKGGTDNETFILTVTNVDDPPIPAINWRYGADYVNITLRVGGQIGNSVTLEIEEDEIPFDEITVERESEFLDEKNLHLSMNPTKSYEIIIKYSGSTGVNPVAVTFECIGFAYTKHLSFDSGQGVEQFGILQLNDIFSAMGLFVFDASSSQDVDSMIVDYIWDFGDGTSGEGIYVVHSFGKNGNYKVNLTVESDNGISDSLGTEIFLNGIPDKEAIESELMKDLTLDYLESTNYQAAFMDKRGLLSIIDSKGNVAGFIDDSYKFDIEGVYLAYSLYSGEIYYLPKDLKLKYNIAHTEENYGLFLLIPDSGLCKSIGVYGEDGGDAIELDEDYDTLTISTSDIEKKYSLIFEAEDDFGKDIFSLTDVKIKSGETHHYLINNWEGITSDKKAVTLAIDRDGDGNIDVTIDLENGMTGEEIEIIILSKGESESSFITTTSLILIVGFVSVAGIGCILGSTEVGKLVLLSLILPLYTRIKKEEVLDNEIRGMIRGYIIANPGDNYNSIKRALSLNNGALAYHLKVLERANIIQSKKDGMFKRFYPAGMKIPQGNGGEISEIQRILLQKISESPGINQKEVAALLGLSKGVINYHIKVLLAKELLHIEKKGRKTHCYIEPSAEHRIKNSYLEKKYEV